MLAPHPPPDQESRRLVLHAPDFSLGETLSSAQMFRWQREGDGYRIGLGPHLLFLRQRGDRLEAHAPPDVEEAFLRHYLALDEDYAALCDRLSADPALGDAVRACRGLRILRQDPWECLVGFICSSCCNVPRIRRIVQGLCDGKRDWLAFGCLKACLSRFPRFPEPGELPDEPALRRLGAGFRAPYLCAVNAPTMRAWLDALRLQEFTVARRRLMTLDGVGEKVADCVLLYGLGFREAFPVDVWVRRAVEEAYFGGRRVSMRRIHAFAAERFGADAGYAQQFLFHYRRTMPAACLPVRQGRQTRRDR